MNRKEVFIKANARLQNYYSHIDTRNKLLEKALDSGDNETRIFDFSGINELLNATIDIGILMFPNIKEEVIKDYIEWFVYENEFGKREFTINDKPIKNSEDLFIFFEEENDGEKV